MQVLSYTEFRENWCKEIMELELSIIIVENREIKA